MGPQILEFGWMHRHAKPNVHAETSASIVPTCLIQEHADFLEFDIHDHHGQVQRACPEQPQALSASMALSDVHGIK